VSVAVLDTLFARVVVVLVTVFTTLLVALVTVFTGFLILKRAEAGEAVRATAMAEAKSKADFELFIIFLTLL
jgi:hypothetical protein